MLRKKFAATILAASAVIVPVTIASPASAATCDGSTWSQSGYQTTWGDGKYVYVLSGNGGNWRSIWVAALDGSSPKWSLGAISQSGAVVESSSTSLWYCINFPGTSKGVKMKANQGGITRSNTVYF